MAGEIRFRFPRDVNGRFLKLNQEVRTILENEAKEYQEQVADYIHHNKLRTSDSTGRLENVTRSPGNRDVKATHWRVGIPSFLNRSEAKYWRLIEQGSEGLYAKGRGFRGTPLMLRPGGFPGGRPFRSFSRTTGRELLNGRNVGGGVNLRRGTIIGNNTYLVYVKNEIRPMNAYHNTFIEHGWRNRIKRDFEQSVRRRFLR